MTPRPPTTAELARLRELEMERNARSLAGHISDGDPRATGRVDDDTVGRLRAKCSSARCPWFTGTYCKLVLGSDRSPCPDRYCRLAVAILLGSRPGPLCPLPVQPETDLSGVQTPIEPASNDV